jgi:hypothetical protein
MSSLDLGGEWKWIQWREILNIIDTLMKDTAEQSEMEQDSDV